MSNGGFRITLANHILPVSATMVGVCMTVISLVQLFPTANVRPWIDDLLAVDSLVFLLSAALSYWSIRGGEGGERYERRADVLFMLGLSVMVVVSFVMAFQLFGV